MILGLDISTSITGWSIVDMHSGVLIDKGHVDLRKIKGIWLKVDAMKAGLKNIAQKYQIKHVYVEESLQRYRSGMSSASTISLLAKFNGLVSYLARELIGVDPVYIASTSARKLNGIKIVRKDPRDAKTQTFEWVSKHLNAVWPMTRYGNVQQYCYDQADAFVVARAGWVQLTTP